MGPTCWAIGSEFRNADHQACRETEPKGSRQCPQTGQNLIGQKALQIEFWAQASA